MQFYDANPFLHRLVFRASHASTLVNVPGKFESRDAPSETAREAGARRDKQIYANGPAFTARDPFAFAKCAFHV